MGKKEEGTVGMNGAIEPTATEVEANNMACCLVTHDPIPTTAVLIHLPSDNNRKAEHHLQSKDEDD